jgi:hypothetical protein
VQAKDRRRNLVLFALAALAWLAVAIVGLNVDPRSSANAGFLGAGVLAAAVALTAAPLLWLVGFARQRRISYRGDWFRALRRGAWIGLLIGLFVVMRINGIFQPPIALFFVALAVVAEVTLTAGGVNRR